MPLIMKRSAFYLIFSFLFSSLLLAQPNLPVKVEVGLPKAFAGDIITKKDIDDASSIHGWGQKKKESKYWVVYSDRDRNVTYKGPDSIYSQYKELSFNDELRIAKIEGNYALVYEEPEKGTQYPAISPKAKYRGWVPMSHLLLWSSCPVNKMGIYNKALLSINLNKKSKEKGISFFNYKNPEDKIDGMPMKTNMQIYFVMKDEGGMALLATQYKIGDSNKILYGWVHKDNFISWDQRTCLEPNWDIDFVENHYKGKTASVYSTPQLNTPITEWVFGQSSVKEEGFEKYRLAPASLRFPILNNDSGNDNLYKCTAYFSANGSMNYIAGQTDDGYDILDNLGKKIRVINLIVVIDGTSSMQPYFKSVLDAISQSIKNFGDNTTLRIGAVVYRDYTEGEKCIERLPLTKATDARVQKFFEDCKAFSSRNDRTRTEALYKGLEVATDPSRMGFDKNESNFLLIIGDCGNDPNDKKCLSQKVLRERLTNNNMQVMTFQVLRNNESPWLLFNEQVTDLMLENADKLYQTIDKSMKVHFAEAKTKDGFDLKKDNSKIPTFYQASMRYGKIGQNLEPAKLTKLIVEAVPNIGKVVENQIDAIPGLMNNTNPVIFQAQKNFIMSRLTEAEWKKIEATNSCMAQDGYVKKKDENGFPLWSPVVYISSDEFESLLGRLKGVYDSINKDSKDRKPYVEAMKALVRSMIPDVSEERMNKMSDKDVMQLITGLNVQTEGLKSHSLKDMQSSKAVPAVEFQKMLEDFKNKYERLYEIKHSDYKYKYSFNGATYYWIPVEDLP